MQEWATNLIAKTAVVNGATWVNPDFAHIPKCMRGLSDSLPVVSVTCSPNGGDAYVVVQYGSGRSDAGPLRGFYVGNMSFKAEGNLRVFGDQQVYVVPWQPGIYFWGEL